MAADPPASRLQRLKNALAARGLSPRRMFGQNFMVDTNFAAAIARDARLDERTLAIEAGPGTGLLTEALLASHPRARVLAIEIDQGLAQLLRDDFAPEIASGRLTLLQGDALAGKHRLNPALLEEIARIGAAEQRSRRILCANLPYNAGTPILANVAIDTGDAGIGAALVTVQLELAERLLAKPGEAEYGALSVLMALRARGHIERVIGAEVFWPRPRVESALLRLDFLPWPEVCEAPSPPSMVLSPATPLHAPLQKHEVPGFQTFLQRVFSQRRKTLRSGLRPRVLPAALAAYGERRAETIAPAELLAIFRTLPAD